MAQITYREAIRQAMAEELRRDERVLFMGEDIADMGGSQGVSKGMLAEFGASRIRNTPISEEGIVGDLAENDQQVLPQRGLLDAVRKLMP